MLATILMLAAATALADVPPVPGLCTASVPTDPETPGCYQTGRLNLDGAPETLFWHVYQFPTPAAARAEAARHRWSTLTQAHGRTWLYLLGGASEPVNGGTQRAVIGPLHRPAGAVTAYFAESIFTPGMRTRVHAHPGPEAFYVVAGEQCMDSPSGQRLVPAGGSHIVAEGLHVQAAPKGRRNLVLILAPQGQPAVIPGGAWKPTGFCGP